MKIRNNVAGTLTRRECVWWPSFVLMIMARWFWRLCSMLKSKMAIWNLPTQHSWTITQCHRLHCCHNRALTLHQIQTSSINTPDSSSSSNVVTTWSIHAVATKTSIKPIIITTIINHRCCRCRLMHFLSRSRDLLISQVNLGRYYNLFRSKQCYLIDIFR